MKTLKWEVKKGIHQILISFTPPCLAGFFPDGNVEWVKSMVPPETLDCYFLAILPEDLYEEGKEFEDIVKGLDKYQKFNIILSGQQQEGFGDRAKKIGVPLSKKGIITLIHCNPYYGL